MLYWWTVAWSWQSYQFSFCIVSRQTWSESYQSYHAWHPWGPRLNTFMLELHEAFLAHRSLYKAFPFVCSWSDLQTQFHLFCLSNFRHLPFRLAPAFTWHAEFLSRNTAATRSRCGFRRAHLAEKNPGRSSAGQGGARPAVCTVLRAKAGNAVAFRPDVHELQYSWAAMQGASLKALKSSIHPSLCCLFCCILSLSDMVRRSRNIETCEGWEAC